MAIQRNLNNAFAYDLVPSVSVIAAALKAARRVNDFPTAVRIFEGMHYFYALGYPQATVYSQVVYYIPKQLRVGSLCTMISFGRVQAVDSCSGANTDSCSRHQSQG